MSITKAIAISLAVMCLNITAAYAANAPIITTVQLPETGQPVVFKDENTLVYIKGSKVNSYSINKQHDAELPDDATDITKLRSKYGKAIALPQVPDPAECTQDGKDFYPSLICDKHKFIVPNLAHHTFAVMQPERGMALMSLDAKGKSSSRDYLDKEQFIIAPCPTCTRHLYAFQAGKHMYLSQIVEANGDASKQGLYRQVGATWNKLIDFDKDTRAVTLSPSNCKMAWMPSPQVIKIADLCN